MADEAPKLNHKQMSDFLHMIWEMKKIKLGEIEEKKNRKGQKPSPRSWTKCNIGTTQRSKKKIREGLGLQEMIKAK